MKEPFEMLKKTIAEILPIVKKTAEKIKNLIFELKKNLANVGKEKLRI